MTRTIERSIDVEVPASIAFSTWTHFELIPYFMDGVEDIQPIDDRHAHWRARIFGVAEEWESEITEQVPDERIAWRSRSGTPHVGDVTFHPLSDARTRVMLRISYEPRGLGERIGASLGLLDRRVQSDLRGFKAFVERHGSRFEPMATRPATSRLTGSLASDRTRGEGS